MKKAFRQFFRVPDAQITELWKTGLFAFDASVLLNVYGYSAETREELVSFLEKNVERVRLPHQFGLEFCRNRRRVIVKQISNYVEVENELKRIYREHIERKRDHPYLSLEAQNAYDGILEELAEAREAMEGLISSDPYCDRILDVFEGKVGKEPTSEEVLCLHEEAKRRYENQTPPGYLDVKEKGVPDGYGDYVGWAQLQEIARAEKRGVIFVTDDFKGDWWYIEGPRRLGPRPELPKEFAHTCNQEILFYNSESFLRAAKKFAAADIGEYTIEEVRRRIESQQESQVSAGLKPPQGDTATQDKQSRGIDSEVQPVAGLKPTVPPTPGTGPTKLPEEDK